MSFSALFCDVFGSTEAENASLATAAEISIDGQARVNMLTGESAEAVTLNTNDSSTSGATSLSPGDRRHRGVKKRNSSRSSLSDSTHGDNSTTGKDASSHADWDPFFERDDI